MIKVLFMKRISLYLIISMLGLTGCGVPQKVYDRVNVEKDSLANALFSLEMKIDSLQNTIDMLSYPASQRYEAVLSLIKNNKLDSALIEIKVLSKLFPKSQEALACDEQIRIIEHRKELKRKEEERRKALGFKIFKDNNAVVITNMSGETKRCVFGNFSYGRTFTFGYCSDVGEYSYRTADKDNTYILTSMVMSTNEKYADIPLIGIFKIKNGKLIKLGNFVDEYASWSSYGAKIGNYLDDTHDFSKVNSVRYKIAVEISANASKQPLVILTAKDGTAVEDELTVEDVHQNYYVIKILNRNKM